MKFSSLYICNLLQQTTYACVHSSTLIAWRRRTSTKHESDRDKVGTYMYMYVYTPSSFGLLGLVNKKDRYEEGRADHSCLT